MNNIDSISQVDKNIDDLDEKYNAIRTQTTDYRNCFNRVLEQFLKDNKLDKDVIKVESGVRGVLKIGASGSAITPFVANFHAYKKDGTISGQHRKNYIVPFLPRNYFSELLTLYKPAETRKDVPNEN